MTWPAHWEEGGGANPTSMDSPWTAVKIACDGASVECLTNTKRLCCL